MSAAPLPPGSEDPPIGAPRLTTGARGVAARLLGRDRRRDAGLEHILDLFEEDVYSGEITADGHYVDHASVPRLVRYIGGDVPAGVEHGAFWESRIHRDDWDDYEAFNQRLLDGGDAEVTYRFLGLDGVTRFLWDRARPRRQADGSVHVTGLITDVTARHETAARLAMASDRFTQLLDVIGEHVYLAVARPDGEMEELFQGPGADRLLGGAEPDSAMENWERALHPDDRPAYDAFMATVAAGESADVEYRLRGADGITRWVHDRAVAHKKPDGSAEVSGIVSDVTERRRMRAELAQAHAALSHVVDAMDAHLFTLRIHPDGTHSDVYRGPNREALVGGALAETGDGDASYAALVHAEDRERWRSAIDATETGEAIDIEYRICGLDGHERIISEQLRPRRDTERTLFFDGVSRDITAQRRLEGELLRSMADMREAHDELEDARRDAELRARTDELTGTFNRRHFSEVTAAALAEAPEGCGLLLLDADHFKQVNDAYGHLVGDAVLVELARRLGGSLGPDDCLARWGGEEFAVLLRGIDSDAALHWRADGLRSAIASTPVTAAGVSLRLTVSMGGVRAGGDIDNLDALVDAADRCLYDAKRHGRNRVSLVPHLATIDAVQDSETVCVARALALVAGGQEEAPRAHAELVAALSAQTAERLALGVEVVLRCRLGGWLHDVGKAAISRAILEKREPLEEGDWAVIRTHPAIGEAIVRDIAALRDAAPAVRHHHERFDGSGYPDGLEGKAIPIEGRIVAAADAYAAITGGRPYAPARSPEDAALELQRGAGTHFDPAVVDALLGVLGITSESDARVA
jgi:diguanylate cyclase (GGDEF)-like protein/PAS domain S-box-containing protein